MKFVLHNHVKPSRDTEDVHSYFYRSEQGLYWIARYHSATKPASCEVALSWKIKKKGQRHAKDLNPRFRITDRKELTGIFLVNEIMGLLRFVPEHIRVGDLRRMVRSFAEHYGTLQGHGRKMRCEVTTRVLARRTLFVKPMTVRRMLREAGITHVEEETPSGEDP